MNIQQKLNQLAAETGETCVTISLNTHRTHPDSEQDKVLLKNLVKEAESRLLNEHNKREIQSLISSLGSIEKEIDVNYNLDSLHLFLSNTRKEIFRSPISVSENKVHIDDRFALRPLIRALGNTESYYILLLSQSGVHLYEATNDQVTGEVRQEGFPFKENQHYITHSDKASDPKQVDNMIREYLNKVDKSVVKMYNTSGMHCVVICTENNYSHLLQVADKASVYYGYVPVDYNHIAPHQIGKQAWTLVENIHADRNRKAITEAREAVSKGTVLTDLQSIYQAATEGRGDLLIVHPSYTQAAVIANDQSLSVVNDPSTPGATDDITSVIAWEVLSKNGRVVFTDQDGLGELGQIVLKTRF